MITERLMAPGEWRLSLAPDTPIGVRQAIDWGYTLTAGLAHIVLVPGAAGMDPATATNPLSIAEYVGVIHDLDTNGLLSGPGLAWWLGTHIIEGPVTFTNGTVADWGAALTSGSLSAGTYTNTGVTLTKTYRDMHFDEALNDAMGILGAEWRINPNGTLDAGPSSIFGLLNAISSPVLSSTPTSGSTVFARRSLRDYRSRAYINDGAAYTAQMTPFATYKDLLGNTANVTEYSVSSIAGAPARSALADRILAAHQPLTYVQVDAAANQGIPVGKPVWVVDEATQLVDPTRMVRFDGVDRFALAARVVGKTWPLRSNYSVWHRAQGASTIWTDLTPWVVFDDVSPITYDLGALPPTTLNPYGRL